MSKILYVFMSLIAGTGYSAQAAMAFGSSQVIKSGKTTTLMYPFVKVNGRIFALAAVNSDANGICRAFGFRKSRNQYLNGVILTPFPNARLIGAAEISSDSEIVNIEQSVSVYGVESISCR